MAMALNSVSPSRWPTYTLLRFEHLSDFPGPRHHGLAIAHLDCDAFYAVIEKRDRPDLRDVPVIVGGRHRGDRPLLRRALGHADVH